MVENNVHRESLSVQELLKPKWNDLGQRLNISNGQESFKDISNNYSKPHRHYHTLTHINNCLQELDVVKPLLDNPKAVELAIWFHDVIYTISQKDNEDKSAEFSKDILQKTGLSSEFITKVSDLILSTKHISPSKDSDTQYLNDIDMAILGQSPDIFDNFDQDIEKEFTAFYSTEIYLNGRIKFFDAMLSRENIFSTDHFKNKYQEQARKNLERKKTELQKRLQN